MCVVPRILRFRPPVISGLSGLSRISYHDTPNHNKRAVDNLISKPEIGPLKFLLISPPPSVQKCVWGGGLANIL